MDPMLFSWQNKCTERFRQKDLSTKNATRRNTQLRQMPGYHETLRPNWPAYTIPNLFYLYPIGMSRKITQKYQFPLTLKAPYARMFPLR